VNIFFDVDYTLISFQGKLRPHVHEVFEKLVREGHSIYIWSGVGLRHEVVAKHNLGQYVSGIYHKPKEDFQHRIVELGVDVKPDFIIDDHGEIVRAFGGYWIKPYGWDHPGDTEMIEAYNAIQSHLATLEGDTLKNVRLPGAPSIDLPRS